MVVVFVKGCAQDVFAGGLGVDVDWETRLILGAKMVRGHGWGCTCERTSNVENY